MLCNIIIRRTQENLRAELTARDDALKGVKKAIDPYNSDVKVHIMGYWLLRIWEMGNFKTSPRETKGNHRITRGSIYGTPHKTEKRYGAGLKRGDLPKPYHFFRSAVQSTEQEVTSTVETNITNSIIKTIEE